MTGNAILKEFQGFAEKTINPLAGPKQHQDVKTAFYAGALSMISIMSQSDFETDEDFINLMDSLHQEINAHFHSVIK